MSDHDNGRPVLAALDFSHDGHAAVCYAADLATRQGRDLVIVHVARLFTPTGPTIMSGKMIKQIFRRARCGTAEAVDNVRRSHPDLPVRARVTAGEPADLLPRYAAEAWLTVIGARGLGGHPDLRWGSISNRLVSRATSPMIVVRADATGAGTIAGDGPTVVLADTAARGVAATEFAESLQAGRATYVVTAHPSSPGDHLSFQSGGLPLDRLIIRVGPTDSDAIDEVCLLAAEQRARLVVVARDRHTWPFRFGPGSTVHRIADRIDCPIAIVDATLTNPATEPTAARVGAGAG